MSAPDIARLVSEVIATTMERSQASFDKDAAAWAAQNKRLNEARSALAAAVAALGERPVTPCPCPHAQRADELAAVLAETREAMGCPEDDSVVRYASVLRRAAEGEYGITQVDLAEAEARGRAAALAALPAQKPPPVIDDDHERGYVNGWNAAVLAAASEIHASGLPFWGARTDGKDGSP